MLSFATRFFYSNLFLAAFVCIIVAVKKLLKNHLSERLQYNLWFLLLFLLGIPLIPSQLAGIFKIFAWIPSPGDADFFSSASIGQTEVPQTQAAALDLIRDFSITVNRQSHSLPAILFLSIWIAGMAVLLCFTLKARLLLYRIKHSALPLQNAEIHKIFDLCRSEMRIKKRIPLYSTAYLKTPIMTGVFRPRIYLPLHLISDFAPKDIRYMLLHELQHYKYKDALINSMITFYGILYWCNPTVRYALREIPDDRELACDSSVLNMLSQSEYKDYGATLINFAEKLSLFPFPFVSGIGGNQKQIKRRIIGIASYRPPARGQKLKGLLIYCLIAALSLGFTPALSADASQEDTYRKQTKTAVSHVDLSSFFGDCQGSFVLYDTASDQWEIYQESLAKQRVSPDSTYKIYSALAALEKHKIRPDSSSLDWDGQIWPFDEWNQGQTLTSALQNSVNWYFQTLDKRMGLTSLEKFYSDIGYGNHDLSGGISDFWMESSLKISPLEQVEMLRKLYTNEFHFRDENIDAVKNALRLSSSDKGILYGKTGTGNVNGETVNGWFIGYVESADTTYFFAVNLQGKTSSAASEIALRILQAKNIY